MLSNGTTQSLTSAIFNTELPFSSNVEVYVIQSKTLNQKKRSKEKKRFYLLLPPFPTHVLLVTAPSIFRGEIRRFSAPYVTGIKEMAQSSCSLLRRRYSLMIASCCLPGLTTEGKKIQPSALASDLIARIHSWFNHKLCMIYNQSFYSLLSV